MNLARPLQLQLGPTTREGVLPVIFQDKSDPGEIPSFMQAIDGRLGSDEQIRQVSFDLSRIDPEMNAAGRLMDLACATCQRWRRPVEVKMPAEIYQILHEIEGGHRVPAPASKPPLIVRGVTVQIVEPQPTPFPGTEAEPAAEEAGTLIAMPELESKTILCCRGKVRGINGSLVTVTLFDKEEKIDGEFDRSQFSRPDLKPGMMFEYQARIKAPGITTVSIDLLTPQYPTDEEMLDASKALRVDFSKF
jgi:hypothetical protein